MQSHKTFLTFRMSFYRLLILTIIISTGHLSAYDKTKDDDHRREKIKGHIQELVSKTEFKVNNKIITLSAETEYEDGSSAHIAYGRYVNVKSQKNDNGLIIAKEIKFNGKLNHQQFSVK